MKVVTSTPEVSKELSKSKIKTKTKRTSSWHVRGRVKVQGNCRCAHKDTVHHYRLALLDYFFKKRLCLDCSLLQISWGSSIAPQHLRREQN